MTAIGSEASEPVGIRATGSSIFIFLPGGTVISPMVIGSLRLSGTAASLRFGVGVVLHELDDRICDVDPAGLLYAL